MVLTKSAYLAIDQKTSPSEKEKNISEKAGTCPDCFETELIPSPGFSNEGDHRVKTFTLWTCRNCGYQDERYS